MPLAETLRLMDNEFFSNAVYRQHDPNNNINWSHDYFARGLDITSPDFKVLWKAYKKHVDEYLFKGGSSTSGHLEAWKAFIGNPQIFDRVRTISGIPDGRAWLARAEIRLAKKYRNIKVSIRGNLRNPYY